MSAAPPSRNRFPTTEVAMSTSLGELLKDPTLISAELIRFQAGQPVVCKLGQNVVPVGAALDANTVNTIIGTFLPPEQLSLLGVQPAVQFNVNVPGSGSYIAKVGKDASGGYQAILQKNAAVAAPAAVAAAPVPMAAQVAVAAAPAPVAVSAPGA